MLKKSLPASLTTAEALFGASTVIGSSSKLRSTLANPAIAADEKLALVTQIFGKGFDKDAAALVGAVTAQRWSSGDDLVAGIEDLALRTAASSVKDAGAIESEIFAFARAVSSDNQLELALGSKAGNPDAKSDLASKLLTRAKANNATVSIVSSLVRSPRGRRIGALLRFAATTVADQSGRIVATVTSARPLTDAQLKAVASTVKSLYGKEPVIDVVVDTQYIGGVRIQVGNDVIDGSVAARLAELRIQLAS